MPKRRGHNIKVSRGAAEHAAKAAEAAVEILVDSNLKAQAQAIANGLNADLQDEQGPLCTWRPWVATAAYSLAYLAAVIPEEGLKNQLETSSKQLLDDVEKNEACD